MLGFNCSMKLVSLTGVDQGSIHLLYTKPVSQVTAVIYVRCNVQSVSQAGWRSPCTRRSCGGRAPGSCPGLAWAGAAAGTHTP